MDPAILQLHMVHILPSILKKNSSCPFIFVCTMSTTLVSLLFILLVCSCSASPILWAGGVTSTSAEFRVESDGDRNFILASEPDFCENSIVYSTLITNGLNAISVQSLKPHQRYYYAVDSDLYYFGEFQTFPPERQHFSFNFTFGSCAFTGK